MSKQGAKDMRACRILLILAGTVLSSTMLVSGAYVQQYKLLPAATRTSYFGQAVGISGNTAIVGAPDDDDQATCAGAAYLFDATTGARLQKLTASDGVGWDFLGNAVGISGGTAVAGAIDVDHDGLMDAGAAYLFNVGTGSQIRKLLPSDPVDNAHFGRSVAIEGNTVVVGAGFGAGSAYVFDAATGAQRFKLTGYDPSYPPYNFGCSVALSGNTLVVGASRSHGPGGSLPGGAFVFDAGTGNQLHRLFPTDPYREDMFGASVAVSGNMAVVGAPYADLGVSRNLHEAGAAYVFDVATGAQIYKLVPSDPWVEDYFGFSVAIAGDLAIVGAYHKYQSGMPGYGAAYVFDMTTGAQLAKLRPLAPSQPAVFGSAVAMTGQKMIVGDYGDLAGGSTLVGSVYIFDVPEPATLSLLALGACLPLRRPAGRKPYKEHRP